MPLTTYLVPIGGALLTLLLIFKGKLHMRVHTWTAYALIAIAVGHGLFATHTFFAWPF
jgi:hypothetical protein